MLVVARTRRNTFLKTREGARQPPLPAPPQGLEWDKGKEERSVLTERVLGAHVGGQSVRTNSLLILRTHLRLGGEYFEEIPGKQQAM